VGYRSRLSARSLITALFSLAIVSAVAVAVADEKPRVLIDVSKASPSASAPKPPSSFARIPPDPPAMIEKARWVFDLRWDTGEPFLVGVNRLDLAAPEATPRAMGRFAVELFEGPTLVERVRFDFPGMGAPEPEGKPGKKPITFEKKMKSRIGVLFPATRRGTRLELWDRATDKRWALPWPIEGAWRPPAVSSSR
jgi:hypothetical protein